MKQSDPRGRSGLRQLERRAVEDVLLGDLERAELERGDDLSDGERAGGDHGRPTGVEPSPGAQLSDGRVRELLGELLDPPQREHVAVVQLMSKAEQFTATDRRRLFDLVGTVVKDIVPRWRRLAASGQVEISSTPHHHPIGPLLLDFATARETQPGLPLPQSTHYAGGRQRLTEHLNLAVTSHAQRFGAAPTGIWPAEGAISDGVLDMFATWNTSASSVFALCERRASLSSLTSSTIFA